MEHKMKTRWAIHQRVQAVTTDQPCQDANHEGSPQAGTRWHLRFYRDLPLYYSLLQAGQSKLVAMRIVEDEMFREQEQHGPVVHAEAVMCSACLLKTAGPSAHLFIVAMKHAREKENGAFLVIVRRDNDEMFVVPDFPPSIPDHGILPELESDYLNILSPDQI